MKNLTVTLTRDEFICLLDTVDYVLKDTMYYTDYEGTDPDNLYLHENNLNAFQAKDILESFVWVEE